MDEKRKYDNINRDELVSLCEKCDLADTCTELIPCSRFVPAVGSNFTESALKLPENTEPEDEENLYDMI